MKPSGQPRLGPATIGGVSGGMLLTGAVVIFTIAIFPPLGVFVGLIVALIFGVKWLNRSQRLRADRAHRSRMDAFYQGLADREREEYWAQRSFTNPGWRL